MSTSSVTALVNAFERLNFATLPSPVFRALAADRENTTNAALANVYVKHDGVCAQHYAGNKVRKLEFLLAEAKRRGARRVITLGAAGSNHAVATSTYAHQLGMTCTVSLSHQPPSSIATKNLRRHLALGTDLHVFDRYSHAVKFAHECAAHPDTYLVPLGGSSPLASLGYINAACELAGQIDQGLLPSPESIYVACGTMGTAVGLTVGLALLKRPIRVVAVRVTESGVASKALFEKLYADTIDLLNSRIPNLDMKREPEPDRYRFENAYFGEAYAKPTTAALEAIDVAQSINLALDGTYTGKAFAALLARAQARPDTRRLFWCTLNSVETPLADRADLARLGEAFKRYG